MQSMTMEPIVWRDSDPAQAELRELLHICHFRKRLCRMVTLREKLLTAAPVLQEHVIVSARCDCYSLAGSSYSPALTKNLGAIE
jgi:hypothetical protein